MSGIEFDLNFNQQTSAMFVIWNWITLQPKTNIYPTWRLYLKFSMSLKIYLPYCHADTPAAAKIIFNKPLQMELLNNVYHMHFNFEAYNLCLIICWALVK